MPSVGCVTSRKEEEIYSFVAHETGKEYARATTRALGESDRTHQALGGLEHLVALLLRRCHPVLRVEAVEGKYRFRERLERSRVVALIESIEPLGESCL